MPCVKCAENPNSHSFHHIGTTKQGYEIIYTCPSKTHNFNGADPDFVKYFDEHLRIIEGKPWVWLFDCSEYSAHHILSLQNIRSVIKYLNEEHGKRLQSTYILHMGWTFHQLLKFVLPLLNNDTQKRIHILSSRPLEALEQFEHHGISPNQIGEFLKSPS